MRRILALRRAMDQNQLDLVRQSFASASRFAPHLASTFYAELFAIDPALRSLFRRDMIALGKKLIDTLTFVVENMHDPALWTPAARDLAQRHVAYGVEARHYDMVGAALMRTLKHELGASFTPEARTAWAWAAAYATLAREMCDAAYPPGPAPSAGPGAAPPSSASRLPDRAT